MNRPGAADLRSRTRAALLDALEALEAQLDALIVIGAQALYLHTGDVEVAIPPETKDADVGIDRDRLRDDPLLEAALERAGFRRDLESPQPGGWFNRDGIPVDVMIPEQMAGPGARNRRGARVPPHGPGAMRRAPGLEGVVVDNARRGIGALAPADRRFFNVRVAGPGALLVAKLHKIGERAEEDDSRLVDKDAHDLYRLLVASDTAELASVLEGLRRNRLSAPATEKALLYLQRLFAQGPDATGSFMAGRAERGVGKPDVVAASVAALAADLIEVLD